MSSDQAGSPPAAPRNETNRGGMVGTIGWVLTGVALAASILTSGFFATASARAKDRVEVALRPDTTAALAAAAVGADEKSPPGTGTLKGVVTFKGSAPKRQLLYAKGDTATVKNEADRAVCAAEDYFKDDLLVNEKGNGVANVFIYLVSAPAGYTAPPVPSEPVVFDQKGCRFLPHVLVLRCDQTLLIKSDDPITHNTHITPLNNSVFNQAVAPNDRKGLEYVYKRPEKQPIPVNCDLHTWMKAHHLPLDHPFGAVTDENGKFEIKGLPPGTHEFRVWHESPGYLQRKLTVEIKADKDTEEKLSYTAAQFKVGN